MNNPYNNRPQHSGQNNGRGTNTPVPNSRTNPNLENGRGQLHSSHPQQRVQQQRVQQQRVQQQPYRTVAQSDGQYRYHERQSGSNYPPVQHKSRAQTHKAAGFVVLVAAILFMLLISVIIFCARCAMGNIGVGSNTTPSGTDMNIGIIDSTDTSDITTDTTEPIATSPPETQLDPKYQYSVMTEADVHRGYLLLINGDNEYNFDGGFTIQDFRGNMSGSYKLGGSYKLDKYAMSWCDKMMDAIKAHMGTGDVLVNSAFRTKEDQQKILDYYLTTKGAEYVEKYVGLPGYSEHHTGLAIDFTIYTDKGESYTFDDKPEYPEWLHANSYKYGFIQRYPADKVDVTGIAYESWHYRFVGKPHAYYMVKENLCFEEYIALLRGFEYGEKHLAITDDEGKSWEIYFVPASESSTTKVPVPKYVEYEISGNNVDGYIVTCYM